MADSDEIARLIARLSNDLRRVTPIVSPWRRASLWLGTVAGTCLLLGYFADGRGLINRSMSTPDLGLAVLGTIITMVLGAIAAFQLSMPDRSSWWTLLPVPGLVLWIGASGLGCLRTWTALGVSEISVFESEDCFKFIVLASVPLSLLMIFMIRRAFTLHPHLATLAGGVGVAAAAALMLNFFHPYDASATDLLFHCSAATMVVGLNQWASEFLPRKRAVDRFR